MIDSGSSANQRTTKALFVSLLHVFACKTKRYKAIVASCSIVFSSNAERSSVDPSPCLGVLCLCDPLSLLLTLALSGPVHANNRYQNHSPGLNAEQYYNYGRSSHNFPGLISDMFLFRVRMQNGDTVYLAVLDMLVSCITILICDGCPVMSSSCRVPLEG